MQRIAHQRCFNHRFREAVACCLECGRYFCRECVTEHDDRVLCADCMAERLASSETAAFRFGGILRLMQFLSGMTLLWLFFYYLGQILISLPTAFHEGTLWQGG